MNRVDEYPSAPRPRPIVGPRISETAFIKWQGSTAVRRKAFEETSPKPVGPVTPSADAVARRVSTASGLPPAAYAADRPGVGHFPAHVPVNSDSW